MTFYNKSGVWFAPFIARRLTGHCWELVVQLEIPLLAVAVVEKLEGIHQKFEYLVVNNLEPTIFMTKVQV